jgi:ATP-binding cassette subfamily F protein 3
LSEQNARSVLGAFRFTGEDVFKPLGLLSGGEHSRVRLATLILSAPEVLILDEPTNHLDIPSREVLEESLGRFAGTILVVSHDRYFLDRIVQRLLVLRPEGHSLHEGNYSYYLEQVEQAQSARATPSPGESRRSRAAAKAAPKPRSTASPYDHLSLEQIEDLILERETELGSLHALYGDSELYRNPERIETLQARTAVIEDELAKLNRVWEERVAMQ